MQELKQGTPLQGGKYIIKRVLGQGGFGITYLAEQVSLGRDVAIKEFFMKDSCVRDGASSKVSVPTTGSAVQVEKYRKKFLKEARTLASLDHPHIVSVIDVWEENGTVYYSMPYMPGGSLRDYVTTNGRMPEQKALRYVGQIASALKYMHEKEHLCHYDIKPANILLDRYDNAVLIDFGISKNYDSNGNETSSTPVGMSEGFAPLEQYQQMVNEFSPTSDVYALGATLFYLLMGKVPPSAISLVQGEELQFDNNVSDAVKQAVLSAVVPAVKKRSQQVDQFINLKISDNADLAIREDETKIISANQKSTEETQIVDTKKPICENPVIKKLLDDMVSIEGGTFTMGEKSLFYSNAKPRHQVTISNFKICKYLVTQELWKTVMGNNPSKFNKNNLLPVECVSWDDCQEFIGRLNQMTGMLFRLPTEAEWEYAARGGRLSRNYKYSGSNSWGEVAWCYENSGNTTHAVGSKKPNELGLFDMSGNVFEWCADWFSAYGADRQIDPSGPDEGVQRVIRGGSYFNEIYKYSVSYRGYVSPEVKQGSIGFRLAL